MEPPFFSSVPLAPPLAMNFLDRLVVFAMVLVVAVVVALVRVVDGVCVILTGSSVCVCVLYNTLFRSSDDTSVGPIRLWGGRGYNIDHNTTPTIQYSI